MGRDGNEQIAANPDLRVPKEAVEKMDKWIVYCWNKQVKPEDKVYILGDFIFGYKEDAERMAAKLNGEKFLIRGNHDKWARGEVKGFAWIRDVYELKECGQKIFMSHYAHRSWPSSHHGAWHLFGHTHNKLGSHGLSFDVGIDTRQFTAFEHSAFLYSIEEVADIMYKLEKSGSKDKQEAEFVWN